MLENIQKELSVLKNIFKYKENITKLEELQKKTLKEDFWKDNLKAKKINKEIDGLKKWIDDFKSLENKIEDIKIFSEMEEEDPDAAKEKEKLLKEVEKEIKEMRIKLTFKDEEDRSNAIVTLHAGAGGTEACDWVEMLLRMYLRYCEKKKFKTVITDILPGEEAGIKRVTFIVYGEYAYGFLKAEIGVHRLVRVSPFDANKRRHTSFAACDVVPMIEEEKDVEINESDLKIDVFRASGKGGQHVNKTESAVRITHIPTGIVVSCQNERSQHQNKAMALKILKSKLKHIEEIKKQEEKQKIYASRGEIGWGYQIRSYVFMPYQMVKDLRTGYETGNVQAVLDGEIEPFIEAYLNKFS